MPVFSYFTRPVFTSLTPNKVDENIKLLSGVELTFDDKKKDEEAFDNKSHCWSMCLSSSAIQLCQTDVMEDFYEQEAANVKSDWLKEIEHQQKTKNEGLSSSSSGYLKEQQRHIPPPKTSTSIHTFSHSFAVHINSKADNDDDQGGYPTHEDLHRRSTNSTDIVVGFVSPESILATTNNKTNSNNNNTTTTTTTNNKTNHLMLSDDKVHVSGTLLSTSTGMCSGGTKYLNVIKTSHAREIVSTFRTYCTTTTEASASASSSSDEAVTIASSSSAPEPKVDVKYSSKIRKITLQWIVDGDVGSEIDCTKEFLEQTSSTSVSQKMKSDTSITVKAEDREGEFKRMIPCICLRSPDHHHHRPQKVKTIPPDQIVFARDEKLVKDALTKHHFRGPLEIFFRKHAPYNFNDDYVIKLVVGLFKMKISIEEYYQKVLRVTYVTDEEDDILFQ